MLHAVIVRLRAKTFRKHSNAPKALKRNCKNRAPAEKFMASFYLIKQKLDRQRSLS